MKKKFFVLFAGLLLTSCYYNAAERNKIIFKDGFNDVQMALIKMSKLVKMLPKSKFNTNYEIKGDSMVINGGPGRDDSLKYYTDQGLSVFNNKEKNEFIELAKYLSKNFISAGFIDYRTNLCLFSYRETPEYNTNNGLREIGLLSDYNSNEFKHEYRVLDKKKEIVLLVFHKAKIYDGFIPRKNGQE